MIEFMVVDIEYLLSISGGCCEQSAKSKISGHVDLPVLTWTLNLPIPLCEIQLISISICRVLQHHNSPIPRLFCRSQPAEDVSFNNPILCVISIFYSNLVLFLRFHFQIFFVHHLFCDDIKISKINFEI